MNKIKFVSAYDAGHRELGGHWLREGAAPVMNNTLDTLMTADHVILVNADGTVTDNPAGVWAPELTVFLDDNGQEDPGTDAELIRTAKSSGWAIQSGWTGQYGYSGIAMHTDERVGGGLAEHVLETPGYWVVTSPVVLPGHCAGEDESCEECRVLMERGADYWLIMHKEA